MKQFVAKKIDLSIGITTLAGDSLTLTPILPLANGSDIKEIMGKFRAIETNSDMTDPEVVMDVVVRELAMVYGKDVDWYHENFDPGTQQEMVRWMAATLRGDAKK